MLPSNQGSLLNVVLDDYLRLKKLFAARLVTKSTSHGDQSSVTEVGGVTGCCICSSSTPLLLTAGWLSPPCPINRNPGFSCCPERSCDPANFSQAVSQPAYLLFTASLMCLLLSLGVSAKTAIKSWVFLLLIFFFFFFLTFSWIHCLPIYNSLHQSII